MEKLFCSKCKEEKPCCDFNKDNRKTRLRGYQSYCRTCEKERKVVHDKEYYKKTIEYQKKRRKEYAATEKGKERIAIGNKKYSISEKGRARSKKSEKKFREKNKEYDRARVAKREADKLKATLNYDIYKNKIKEIYKNCPVGYQVDHIVPLRGKTVCGLHVPWNLQYLTPTENKKKGNRLI